MFAKLIICTVDTTFRDQFSQAQKAWSECSNCSGFKRQLGGWDSKHDKAIILSLWKDKQSLSAFMQVKHDEIESRSMQVHTYQDCVIEHLANHIKLAGNKQSENQTAKVLRISDFCVSPENSQRFFSSQESIWNPTMKNCEGFCGGNLWRHDKDLNRYFVITEWSSIDKHVQYVRHILPRLKNESNLSKMLYTARSFTIILQNDWEIMPSAT